MYSQSQRFTCDTCVTHTCYLLLLFCFLIISLSVIYLSVSHQKRDMNTWNVTWVIFTGSFFSPFNSSTFQLFSPFYLYFFVIMRHQIDSLAWPSENPANDFAWTSGISCSTRQFSIVIDARIFDSTFTVIVISVMIIFIFILKIFIDIRLRQYRQNNYLILLLLYFDYCY